MPNLVLQPTRPPLSMQPAAAPLSVPMLAALRGLSAYEVAVADGFEGTVEEWLASLVADATWDTLPGKPETFPPSAHDHPPAGADTQVQFNDGGAPGADADLTWNKATNTLAVAGNGTFSGTLQASGGTSIFSTVASPDVKVSNSGLLGFSNGSNYERGLSFNGADALEVNNGTRVALGGSHRDIKVRKLIVVGAQGTATVTCDESGPTLYISESLNNGFGLFTPVGFGRSLRLDSTVGLAFNNAGPSSGAEIGIKKIDSNTLELTSAMSGGTNKDLKVRTLQANTVYGFDGYLDINPASASPDPGARFYGNGRRITLRADWSLTWAFGNNNAYTAPTEGVGSNAIGVVEINKGQAVSAGGTLGNLKLHSLICAGPIKHAQYTNATEPSYVNGDSFFNTDLDKLRIGGAAGWETVTSA